MPNSGNRRPAGVWITLVILLAIVGLIYFGYWSKQLSREKPEGLTLLQQGRGLGEVGLLDARGQPFSGQQLQGRWSVLFFGFTHCPSICPTTLAVMASAIDALAEPVLSRSQFVMVTVDPSRDTPARLESYLARFDTSIVGVTGEAPALADFRKSIGAYAAEEVAEDGDVAHSAALFLINPEGQFAGVMSAPVTAEGLSAAMNYLTG
ncbi:MAG: SCO family protein [Gammaproteobacteria bacterium]|nr:SCO family protein [Gammaproteobacteria bacterium]